MRKKYFKNEILDKIIQGDAEQILKKFPDNFVHLIVSSPPYNVGQPYEYYKDTQEYERYLEKMKRILNECYRVLVKGGRIVLNLPLCIKQHSLVTTYLAIDFLLAMREIGFLDREIITWLKNLECQPVGKSASWGSWKSASNPVLRNCSEILLVMHKETPELKGSESDITKKEFLKWTTNCWLFSPSTPMRKFHPAPFPFELPRRAIKMYSFVGQVILDPFCGTGTTCLVAKQLRRRYIGIDVSRKYCEIARRFLSQVEFNF